jgi:branched-chain amino acid aminotransferase
MSNPRADFIWMDGKLVPWDEANVHIMTHTLHYGLGMFEGIRCYRRADGRSHVFRLREHLRRLQDSAHMSRLELPFSVETLATACKETLKANRQEEAYLRPLVFIGDGAMGLGALHNPTRVAVISWQWGAYLGDKGLREGIRAKVSSFQRIHPNTLMNKGKIVGHYVNSIMAKREALEAGYDEAILLDHEGYVCEASGENIFVVRDGVVRTTPLGSSILGGITRDTVITILRDAGIRVEETRFAREELYVADEVFFCGTAAEVTPVREVDNRRVGAGKVGEVTSLVQRTFFDVVKGTAESYPQWLDWV